MGIPISNFLSGAKVIIEINNRPIGFALGIHYQIRIEYRDRRCIDYSVPVELAPFKTNVSGQIFNTRIKELGPSTLGIMPTPGNIPYSPYVTLRVYTKQPTPTTLGDSSKERQAKNNTNIITFKKVMFVDRSESIPAANLMTTTLSFIGTTWEDEKQDSIPVFNDDGAKYYDIIKPNEVETYWPDMIRDYTNDSEISKYLSYGTAAINFTNAVTTDLYGQDKDLIKKVRNTK